MNNAIYLVSWPRSGNTLLRAILWQCFGIKSSSMHGESLLMQDGCRELVGADPGAGMIIKTHCCYTSSSIPDDAQIIYLMRDGRDACVSYWHYYRDILKSVITLADIIKGNCIFGSWSDHVCGWTTRRSICLSYEKLVPGRYQYTDGAVVDRDVLQILGEVVGTLPDRRDIAPWYTFHRAHPTFFRRGQRDSWRDEMTGDDLALFYKLHGDTMRQCGYLDDESKGACDALAATQQRRKAR